MTTPSARRTAAVEETEGLGEALAPALQAGDLLALCGPLGAGKTRFVAGLARGLAAAARVRSPTYTIVNEYHGRLVLVHLDLYRLEARDVDSLGIEEHLERGVLAVEWGEKLPATWRADALILAFSILSADEREIVVTGAGARGTELLQAWEALASSRGPTGARVDRRGR